MSHRRLFGVVSGVFSINPRYELIVMVATNAIKISGMKVFDAGEQLIAAPGVSQAEPFL
jgi:hypothetical protein